MNFKTLAAALLAGSAIAFVVPSGGYAETLRVLNGASSSTLSIPMNRAVVVETDTPFAELSIANPGIADISTLSDRSIYVLGKAPGRTTLTILGADGSLFSNVDVQVTPDIAEFRERLRQILPNERIEVRTANDGIVLSGVVSTAARLDAAMELAQRYAPERVSNLMSVGGTQQVMLKVRFAEMNREVRKNLGASFQIGNPTGRVSMGTGALDGTSSDVPGGTPSPPNSRQLPGSTTSRQGALGFRVGGGSLTAQVLLEALETQGMLRTLAEPNLTALSGQEASFLAGGEVPVPIISDGSVAVEYRPFGVGLSFTPRVLDDNVINLSLNASVRSIDPTLSSGATPSGISEYAFRTRETQTTVELRDGESFAIAGLLQDDFSANSTSIPWLSDIPILGALFRSSSYQRDQTELVIVITAHLVTPTRGEALMLPTDRVRPPSERDLFLSGRLTSRNSGAEGEVARQDFGGSYGYVFD
ncbi:type II and III secretion system protein family protein [Roseinatronobacter sp.]